MKIKNIILLLAVSIISFGCGGPSAITVKPSQLKNIKNIGILEIQEPGYRMMDLGSATPWGAASAASDAQEIHPKFMSVLKKERFSFNKYLAQELHRSLRRAGYKTYSVKVKRTGPIKLLENYKKYNSPKIDALLDVAAITAGYVIQHGMMSTHWRPETRTFVKLVNARDASILHQDIMMYGYHNPFMSGVDIDAPEKFHYQERADIFKAGNKAVVAGLKDAAKKVAMELGKQLKK